MGAKKARYDGYIALAGLWLPAFVNLAGLRSIAAFQVVTTVLKFVPLLLVSVIGLFVIVQLSHLGAAANSEVAYWCHFGGMVAGAVLQA